MFPAILKWNGPGTGRSWKGWQVVLISDCSSSPFSSLTRSLGRFFFFNSLCFLIYMGVSEVPGSVYIEQKTEYSLQSWGTGTLQWETWKETSGQRKGPLNHDYRICLRQGHVQGLSSLLSSMETRVMSVWLWSQGPGRAGGWHHRPGDSELRLLGGFLTAPKDSGAANMTERVLGVSCFHLLVNHYSFTLLPAQNPASALWRETEERALMLCPPGDFRTSGRHISSPKRASCWHRPLPPRSSWCKWRGRLEN